MVALTYLPSLKVRGIGILVVMKLKELFRVLPGDLQLIPCINVRVIKPVRGIVVSLIWIVNRIQNAISPDQRDTELQDDA